MVVVELAGKELGTQATPRHDFLKDSSILKISGEIAPTLTVWQCVAGSIVVEQR